MKSHFAKADCPLCRGTGGYSYDENHSTYCKLCCPHERYYLQSDGHPHPGEITCASCGWEARHEPWRAFYPSEEIVAGEYRILWSKRVASTPHMPPPKVSSIVHEACAVFGRKTTRGRVAIADNPDRLRYKDSSFEVDPALIIAIMRLI